MSDKRSKSKDYLFEAILSLETIDDCYSFFADICTVKELNELSKRMCGAKMLNDGMVYSEITNKTGLSTATISRINRSLKYGRDGYARVIRRLDEKGIACPDEIAKEDR